MSNSRHRLLRSLVTAVLVAAFAVPGLALITVTGPNGFLITLNASYGPFRQPLGGGVQEGGEGRILHRFVWDQDRQRYFAYDLVMTPSGLDKLQVRIEPLSLAAAEVRKWDVIQPSWTAVPLPKAVAAKEIKAGDELTVELLQSTNPDQRVVDHLAFAR